MRQLVGSLTVVPKCKQLHNGLTFYNPPSMTTCKLCYAPRNAAPAIAQDKRETEPAALRAKHEKAAASRALQSLSVAVCFNMRHRILRIVLVTKIVMASL